MKRVLVLGVGVLIASIAWGQGTVDFNNRVGGVVVCHVYLGYGWSYGNSPSETPPGTVDWSGFTKVAGSNYFAALIAAPGPNAPFQSLVQAEPVTTFRTGAAAGNVAPVTATLSGVPRDAAVATVAMVAWEDIWGIFTNWTLAKTAWAAGMIRAGQSEAFNVYNVGGDLNTPAYVAGLRSFNILSDFVPCPCSISLHPKSQLAVAGQTIAFEVQASGPREFHYQWVRNKWQIPGATGMRLTLTNVTAGQEGTYAALVVAQASGAQVSSNAVLKVISGYPLLRAGQSYGGLDAEGFHFTLVSEAGLICSLERSTNLVNWEEFLAVTNSTGELRLTDPNSSVWSSRFYRAVARLP